MHPDELALREMLREAGHASIEALLCARGLGAETEVPAPAHGVPEQALRLRLQRFAAQTTPASRLISFLGAGRGDHYLPAAVEAVERAPVLDPAEAARLGRRFTSRIGALTAMPRVAPGTFTCFALAEAVAKIIAAERPGRKTVALAATLPPSLAARLQRAFIRAGLACRSLAEGQGTTALSGIEGLDETVAAVLVASPNGYGCLEALPAIAVAARRAGALMVVAVDPLSLALLAPPGEIGADLCFGDLRCCGLSDRTTGEAWFLAAHNDGMALPPGIIGAETRRVVAFLDWVGEGGLRDYAAANYKNAHFVHRAIGQIAGYRALFAAPFFNEFVVETPLPAAEVVAELEEQGIAAGVPLPEANRLLVAVTENRTLTEIEYFLRALKQLRDRHAGRILGVDS